MAFQPPSPVRERILAFGHPGSGKSTAWLQIARLSQLTKSDAHFYVLDTDAAVDRMLTGKYAKLENVTYRPVFDWEEYVAHTKEFAGTARPQDWIVVDMVGAAWQSVQQFFIEKVFEKDPDQYWLEARQQIITDPNAAKQKRGGFEGFSDWGYINKLYNSWMNTLIHRSKANVFACAAVSKIDDRADKVIRDIFGPFGVAPVGQKHLGYSFHTVLLMKAKQPGADHRITTVKDRERTVLENAEYKDFATDYLKNVAGWTLGDAARWDKDANHAK